jgi:hypothetical protein
VYATVAGVLRRLGNAVRRHSDRRVELAHVPREEWARFFAVSSAARSVLRFSDRSDQPASPDALLGRLRDIAPRGVAVGGVAAEGAPWTDPVECLLDLHEAGLESQALELLDQLQAGVGGRA